MLLPARLEAQGTNPVSAVTVSLLEPGKQVVSPVSHPHSHLCTPSLQPFPHPQTPLPVPTSLSDLFLLTGRSLQLDLPGGLHQRCQVRGETWGRSDGGGGGAAGLPGSLGFFIPSSVSKRDERCCFLYALPPAQDVQLCFPSGGHCQWCAQPFGVGVL